jgi:signal transduction histidine kinase
MLSVPRFLALSLLLLIGLLGAGLAAQAWLRQQETRLRQTERHLLEQQLRAAVAVTGRLDQQWSEVRLSLIKELLQASVERSDLSRRDEGPVPTLILEVEPGVWLAVTAPRSPMSQGLRLLQRILVALAVLTVLCLGALVTALALRRPVVMPEQPTGRDPRDLQSLAHLAETSATQQVELDRERDERLRAEEAARLRLQLLNQALEAKIRLGRDLHDGVIQSLYAAGLTLQSAQAAAERDPEEAARRVETTLALINRTIGEIRAYIEGLSPLAVRGSSLAQALRQVVEELCAGRPRQFEVQVDERSAAQLSDEQAANTLQIVREAVSNAWRHGTASSLKVHLEPRTDGISLTVEDNGTGFDPQNARPGGHGLANMRARAERAGGRLTLDSEPGRGARIQLFWPFSPNP